MGTMTLPDEAGAEQLGRESSFTIGSLLLAVRQRWPLVLAVVVLTTVIGTWRAVREQRRYSAFATARVAASQNPLPGVTTGAGGMPDYRIDRMVTEMRVVGSSNVAERAAVASGLRLRVVQPERTLRSMIFGDAPIVIDRTAPSADYRLVFDPSGYQMRAGAVQYGPVRYGDTLRAPGMRLVVPVQPKIDGNEAVISIVSPTAAAGEVLGGLGTTNYEKTDIVEIRYTGTDPIYVARIADAVTQAYSDFSREKLKTQTNDRSAFVRGALDSANYTLAGAQDRLRLFRERNQIVGVAPEQIALAERIQVVETEQKAAQLEQDTYANLIGSLTEADTTDEQLRRVLASKEIAGNPNVAELSARWFELIQKRQELRGSRSEGFADVRDTDALILRTKQDLQAATRVYLQQLKSRLQALDRTLAQLRAQMGRYPSLAAEEARLLANERSYQKQYDELLGEYQKTRIAASVNDSPVQLIDAATVPQWPVSPNRRRALLLSLAAGLFLGVLAAVLLERLDNTLKSPEEVRDRLGLNLLGIIPGIGERNKADPAISTAAGRLVSHVDPKSSVAEAYRTLRTNLAFARAHQDLRTLAFTSPGPADGKSTTAANLAITFAQQGQRTLIVDADLRRAVLDKTFSVPRSPGLTDCILGTVAVRDAARPTEVPNLFVLPSGQFPPNPSELLGSPAMRDLLEAAKQEFDVIIFDSPPLLAVTDAAVLSTMVDGTVLVLRVGSTAREAARTAISHLAVVHGRLLGGVLNDVDLRSGSYYGGYGYYYSYYGSESAGGNGAGSAKGMDRVRNLIKRKPRSRKS